MLLPTGKVSKEKHISVLIPRFGVPLLVACLAPLDSEPSRAVKLGAGGQGAADRR